MKQVRFRDSSGAVRTGEWHGDAVSFGGARYDFDEIDILPPSQPEKIVCIGRNYADHAAETDSDVPDRPLLFLKPPNTVAGHGDTIVPPAGKDRIDYEAELAVVIGEQCRHVLAAEAMDVVAGFTVLNDVSNRDDQRREQNWVRGKAFDGAAPMGPVLASPDEVPEDAAIELRVDGDLRQEGTRADMVFSVPDLVAEITAYVTLEPGDVIATGTPSGVGPLTDGDHVEIDIEGIGTLEHDVLMP